MRPVVLVSVVQWPRERAYATTLARSVERTGIPSSTAKSWNHRTSHAQHVNAKAAWQLLAATGHRSPSQDHNNPPKHNNHHSNNHLPKAKEATRSHGSAPYAKRDTTTNPQSATKAPSTEANALESKPPYGFAQDVSAPTTRMAANVTYAREQEHTRQHPQRPFSHPRNRPGSK